MADTYNSRDMNSQSRVNSYICVRTQTDKYTSTMNAGGRAGKLKTPIMSSLSFYAIHYCVLWKLT